MINFEQWEGFEGRIWKEEVNVRDFFLPDTAFKAFPLFKLDHWNLLAPLRS